MAPSQPLASDMLHPTWPSGPALGRRPTTTAAHTTFCTPSWPCLLSTIFPAPITTAGGSQIQSGT